MISQTVREFRVESILSTFSDSVFLTLTTPDVVDILEIRKRWRKFRHDYFGNFGVKARWVMCFEPHPNGHGWHIHIVIEGKYYDVNIIRKISTNAGFGRIHIERCDSSNMARYVSKYVCKIERSLKIKGCRIRLLNTSRGLTTLADIRSDSPQTDYIRSTLKFPVPETYRYRFVAKVRFAQMYLLFGNKCNNGYNIPAWDEIRSDALSQMGDDIAKFENTILRTQKK